jgi:hypothetical protein
MTLAASRHVVSTRAAPLGLARRDRQHRSGARHVWRATVEGAEAGCEVPVEHAVCTIRAMRPRERRPSGSQHQGVPASFTQHATQNAMAEAGEIARFYDSCSDLMRELLDALAAAPDQPRTFPEIEDAMGWPRRRIASVLGGVAHLRQTEFGGRRPYRLQDERRSPSGRWEMWMDADQAQAVRAARGA